jgi:septal ring factor EnvC (AmiA/AmiB activator)
MVYQQPSTQGKSSQIREIQNHMTMLESDIGKKRIEEGSLIAGIRKLEKDEDRAKIELQNMQKKLEEVRGKIGQLDKSVADLEKKQNAL